MSPMEQRAHTWNYQKEFLEDTGNFFASIERGENINAATLYRWFAIYQPSKDLTGTLLYKLQERGYKITIEPAEQQQRMEGIQ